MRNINDKWNEVAQLSISKSKETKKESEHESSTQKRHEFFDFRNKMQYRIIIAYHLGSL
jgi:hypothetical protein